MIYLLLFLATSSAGLTYDDLFPYGSTAGDAKFPPNDDGSTSFDLNFPFKFYGTPYNKTYVNNNGVISFVAAVDTFTPDAFPLNFPLIAPFWADVDTRGIGNVWYRLTTDATTVLRVREEVSTHFTDNINFLAREVLIVTWDQVGYYNARTNKNNTFQSVLAGDGDSSYVMFLYPENGINWYSGDASNGIDGIGGIPALVGLNKGDGVIYNVTNVSSTEDVINVENYSNVNEPGLYIWRVTNNIEDGGSCINSNTSVPIKLTPSVGHQLGGTTVIITGPCFDQSDTIKCQFGSSTVPGARVSSSEALCVSPVFDTFTSGYVDFSLLINGTIMIGTSKFYIHHFADMADVLMVTNNSQFLVQPNGTIELQWHPKSIFPQLPTYNDYTVDIELYWLGSTTWAKNSSVSYNHDNTGSTSIVMPSTPFNNMFVPIAFKVSVDLNEVTSTDSKITALNLTYSQPNSITAGRWTHVIVWRATDVTDYCGSWDDNYARNPMFVKENFESCPCNTYQAELPSSGFEQNTSPGRRLLDQFLHSGSSVCYLQSTTVIFATSTLSFGKQECCYNADGNLITGPPNGGHELRRVEYVHPDLPYSTFPLSWLDFFNNDIAPYIGCCITSTENCNDIYYVRRPSDNCSGFDVTAAGYMFGDPHLLTLDGYQYTFNGRGEFILIETADDRLTVQGRMIALMNNGEESQGTVFSSLAAKQNDSDTVELQSSFIGVRVFVNGGWEIIDTSTAIQYNNVIVRNRGNETYSAVFSSGASIEVKQENGFLARVSVSLPDAFKHNTNGLLGAFDGSVNSIQQELISRNGIPLPSRGFSNENIHDIFGLSWIVDNSSESLFTYSNQDSFTTYYQPEYTPAFQPNFSNDSTLQAAANQICQGNVACLFDIAATGSIAIGASTIEQMQTIENMTELSRPIVCNPPCANGACVSANVCNCPYGYEGDLCEHIIDFECDDNPCENNGTCYRQLFTTICNCTSPYTGRYCQYADCGNLEIPQPLIVTYNDTLSGSIAVYSCVEGYAINEYTESICTDDGIWDTLVTPYCTVDCGTLDTDDPHLMISYNSTLINSVATYTCSNPDQYILIGNSSRTCTSTGAWSNEKPYCETDCGTLEATPPLVVTYNNTLSGSIAVYSCTEGYAINKYTESICADSGIWDTPSTPYCTVDCGSLDTDDPHLMISYNSTLINSIATYTCSNTDRYILIGNSSRTCTSTGAWSDDQPYCEINRDCGQPPLPSNHLTVTFNSTITGSIATYSCPVGYQLEGSSQITCEEGGVWSKSSIGCLRDCGIPPISNDDCLVIEFYNGTAEGSIFRYNCKADCILEGSPILTCLSDGNWSPSLPSCTERIDCGQPPLWNAGLSVSYNDTRVGSVATYSCISSNHRLVNGNITLICDEETGEWTGSLPVCEEIPPYDITAYIVVGSTLFAVVIVAVLVIIIVAIGIWLNRFRVTFEVGKDEEYTLSEI